MKHLRPSGDGTYKLQSTVTWKIIWRGAGVNGAQDVPPGEFGADQDVILQEIQSIKH